VLEGEWWGLGGGCSGCRMDGGGRKYISVKLVRCLNGLDRCVGKGR